MKTLPFHFGHFVFDNAPHLTRCAPIRAVTGTHFATQVPAYQYPAGTRVPV